MPPYVRYITFHKINQASQNIVQYEDDQVLKLQKIMFFYVYTIHSKRSDKMYTGYTSNLIRRVKEHNLGLNLSTKSYRPWTLIHYEGYRNRADAKRREKYLKTSQGGRLLRRRVKDYLHNLLRFA